MADDKNYIIEPITCLCKIALLYFMPEKTKIAISHHVLYLQEYSYYQWLERMKNGDSRIDISNLNSPILKAIKWYILDGPDKIEMDDDTNQSIRTITNFAISGLMKLQRSTYNSDCAIKIILQYFINNLRNALNDEWKDNECIPIESGSYALSEEIKNGFEPHTINSISKMLGNANNENSADNIAVLIECAHGLLINRDTNFVKMMKKVNTTL